MSVEVEHSLVKIPAESLTKACRSSQKTVEKELAAVLQSISDVKERPDLDRKTACETLDTLVCRLNGLKRKVEETKKSEQAQIQKCRTRIDYLSAMDANKGDPESAERWNRERLDRILVEYLLRQGHYETAQQMAAESGIEEYVDIEIFLESRKILDSLRAHDCGPALAWCAEHKSKLRKQKSPLEFKLRLQEFIELVRMRKLAEAIQYSRKHFPGHAKEHMPQIQQAMATLAFAPDTTCPTYQKLFDQDAWKELMDQFGRESLTLHCAPQQAMLYLTLGAGLAALKTPYCFKCEARNINCPVCAEGFSKLAADLPYAHHIRSVLVCRISGKVMNEDDPPMVLPNGQVYSEKALAELAEKGGGWFTDPRTNKRFRMDQLRKAFIM